MDKTISIAQFISAIRRLPSGRPKSQPGVWYKTQKEHWLGWLKEYHGPGAYGRKTGVRRDARYAYNHIVCEQMLLWIITAAGVNRRLVTAARRDAERGKTLMQKSAAIRRHVPWEVLAAAVWG